MSASIIKGALVPNATAYNLYEKVTTGQTVEYVFKATNTEINFNLTTLNLSEGDHTFVVQATAPGYESSDYSNEVTYTAGEGVELISFTIAGKQYYAEPDMTWGDWVNSEYNVDDAFDIYYTYIAPNGAATQYVALDGVGVTKDDTIIANATYTIKYGGGGAD